MFSHSKIRKYSNKNTDAIKIQMIDYNNNKGPLIICN